MPPPPDYKQPGNWAAFPGVTSPAGDRPDSIAQAGNPVNVDVFFVHLTLTCLAFSVAENQLDGIAAVKPKHNLAALAAGTVSRVMVVVYGLSLTNYFVSPH